MSIITDEIFGTFYSYRAYVKENKGIQAWGYSRDNAIKNLKRSYRYGLWVRNDIPITGVVGNNTPEWLIEGCIYDSIDLTCLNCQEENADNPDYDFENSVPCDGCMTHDHTLLVGDWKQDDKGQYKPDKEGPNGYSAICEEIYAQIVWSKHTKLCQLCSPCYPGQGDLDTSGEWLTYDLPADVWGSADK